MPITPKFFTVRGVISSQTIEKLFTKAEICRNVRLGSYFDVKPEAHWFFCVFVFSVARESPSTLKITVVSTTVARTHKYTITPGLLDVAPEITGGQTILVKAFKAHCKAEEHLLYLKINQKDMSEYTRRFMDSGAGDGEPLQLVINDLDCDPNPKEKPGLFMVKKDEPGE